MPEEIVREIWALIPTVLYFVVGLVLFLLGVLVMDRVTPFSVRKEIEEDQNVALGVIMGSALIGLAIILAAAIRG